MHHLCSVVIILQMALLTHSSTENNTVILPEESNVKTLSCMYEPAESCPDSGCKFTTPSNDSVLCCNMTAFEFKEKMMVLQKSFTLTRLHVRNTTIQELNMNLFQQPSLESIAFTDGKLDRVVRPNYTYLSNLQCLNLSSNQLSVVDSHLLESLPGLRHVDLSYNNLTNLSIITPGGRSSDNKELHLDISYNGKLWCNNIRDFTESMKNSTFNLSLVNQDTTMCVIKRGDYWFDFVDTIPYQQLERIKQIEDYCLKNTPCTCVPYRLTYNNEKVPFLGISVNCTGKNLTALPALPKHTIMLNVADNSISNLKRIKSDPLYSELREFYARNNQISTMQDIEGSDFLRDFQILDIRDNKLTEIQTYIFNHAFEHTTRLQQVMLSGNKVKCDCNTAQHVKLWLLKNRKHIIDYNDIGCENINSKITALDPNTVCKYPRVWTDYINYIIACEVIMLFLLVSKVSYDYWVFRTAGYLPWPASKMPKMPCDWVFET